MAGKMVSFPSNGQQAEGYLAMPASGKGAGIVVIQEWWGLNENIKGIADRLAAEGYRALAPDLYHGKETAEPDDAMKLMMAMNRDQAAKDMSGAYDHLKAHEAGTGKVGSIGWCMGGGLSLYLATQRPVDACVVFYGVLPAPPDVTKLAGPVLGHYAANDGYLSVDSVRSLEKQINDAGKSAEFHIYENTQHGFFNDSEQSKKGGVHAPEAAQHAWERTIGFYKKNLS